MLINANLFICLGQRKKTCLFRLFLLYLLELSNIISINELHPVSGIKNTLLCYFLSLLIIYFFFQKYSISGACTVAHQHLWTHTHLYTKLPQKCQSERVIVAFVLLNIRVAQKGGPWRSLLGWHSVVVP